VIYYINFTFDVFPQLRNVKENTTTDSPANGEGKSGDSPDRPVCPRSSPAWSADRLVKPPDRPGSVLLSSRGYRNCPDKSPACLANCDVCPSRAPDRPPESTGQTGGYGFKLQ
jgi:hypothetical protein